MSRIGRKPIVLKKGVTVSINDNVVEVKGPSGTLKRTIPPEIIVKVEPEQVLVSVNKEVDSIRGPKLFGLTRTLVDNMVQGVASPWKKDLEIQGVGFRAFKDGQKLNLQVGFSHPVNFNIPATVQFTVDAKQTLISLTCPDKELLGTIAAQIRAVRPPEPYKGKGIRYAGEQVLRKAGKAAGAVGAGSGGKK